MHGVYCTQPLGLALQCNIDHTIPRAHVITTIAYQNGHFSFDDSDQIVPQNILLKYHVKEQLKCKRMCWYLQHAHNFNTAGT